MSEMNVVPLRQPDASEGSRVVSDETDVRSLIPGGEYLTEVCRFASDTWDLAGHPTWSTKVGSRTKLNFSGVPDHWRTAAKEWALLCLNPSLAPQWKPDDPVAQTWPQNQEPARPATVQGNLKQLRLMLTLLDKYGIYEPDSDGWARVVALMRQPQTRGEKLEGTVLSPGTLRGRAYNVKTFWSIRSVVGRPTLLGSEPFDGEDPTALFGSGSAPKKNLRRPHEDVGRCLGLVAWVFDNLSDDILAHLRWWYGERVTLDQAPVSREEGRQEMVGLLHELINEQGALPASKNANGGTTLAHSALGWLLRVETADEAFDWGRYALRQFENPTLDLTGGNPCPLPIRELPRADGSGEVAWADRLLMGDELRFWASALVYYGMVYIAATCGLRDGDLSYLPLGCLERSTKLRPSGEEYEVFELHGYKQKNRTTPVRTSWPVNGRIARIIDVVTELHEIYDIEAAIHPQTGEKCLFDAQLITSADRSGRKTVHLDLKFVTWLKKGAGYLHERGLIHDNLDDLDGVNSSTIRITALQAYAARPLGNALAAAFGQWSTQNVAMGYHMDVYKIISPADPMDAAEFQAEFVGRTLANASRDVKDLRGSGVPRLQQVIERNARQLANPAPLSASRIKRLGKDNPNIEVGPYTICVYSPDGALCGGKGSADFRLCRPFECRNSAMTPGQRARVELRRRLEAAGSAVQQRSAKKLAEGMPEIVEEFEATPDDDLVRLVAQEMDDYIVEALGLDEGEPK
jgi:hypothetical protein